MTNIMHLDMFLPDPKLQPISMTEAEDYADFIKGELAAFRAKVNQAYPDGLMEGDASDVTLFLKRELAGLSEITQRWLVVNPTWV
jgi:hypothetical protein